MDKNMKYLPLNINLYDKKVVIYGGGEVAYSKAKILANFCNNITVIAAEFDERFSTLKNITLVKKQIEESDLSDCYSLVICALDNEDLNRKIAEFYIKRNILVNVVDRPALCSAIFPAILQKGDVLIAISTGGKVPGFSRYLKKSLNKVIPQNVSVILKELHCMREKLKEVIPDFKKRMRIIRRVLSENDFLAGKYRKKSALQIRKQIRKAFEKFLSEFKSQKKK